MPTHSSEPDTPAAIVASKPAEMKAVECKSCGKAHEPILEFRDDEGNHVCSWECLGVQVWIAIYGFSCPPERLRSIRDNEANYWREYRALTK